MDYFSIIICYRKSRNKYELTKYFNTIHIKSLLSYFHAASHDARQMPFLYLSLYKYSPKLRCYTYPILGK